MCLQFQSCKQQDSWREGESAPILCKPQICKHGNWILQWYLITVLERERSVQALLTWDEGASFVCHNLLIYKNICSLFCVCENKTQSSLPSSLSIHINYHSFCHRIQWSILLRFTSCCEEFRTRAIILDKICWHLQSMTIYPYYHLSIPVFLRCISSPI